MTKERAHEELIKILTEDVWCAGLENVQAYHEIAFNPDYTGAMSSAASLHKFADISFTYQVIRDSEIEFTYQSHREYPAFKAIPSNRIRQVKFELVKGPFKVKEPYFRSRFLYLLHFGRDPFPPETGYDQFLNFYGHLQKSPVK